MKRRSAVAAMLVVGAMPLNSFAQTGRPPKRIGYLGLSSAQANVGFLAAFRAGMVEQGLVEGRDYVIEPRFADGVTQAVPALAAELVASRPDLLLTPGDAGVLALAHGTKTIPVIVVTTQDPVGSGLAASLRRPGGNVTGLSSMSTELWPKRLQLLKEAFPRVAHLGVLLVPSIEGSVSQAKEIESVAARLGWRVSQVEIRQPSDVDPAFKRSATLGAEAWAVTYDGLTLGQSRVIADYMIRMKVPAMFAFAAYAEAGGLMSYAASFTDNFRRAAAHVDKIFKGAKPGDLPIEQPTRFELVVNMKTAKAIGVTIRESVMVGVDRVIE